MTANVSFHHHAMLLNVSVLRGRVSWISHHHITLPCNPASSLPVISVGTDRILIRPRSFGAASPTEARQFADPDATSYCRNTDPFIFSAIKASPTDCQDSARVGMVFLQHLRFIIITITNYLRNFILRESIANRGVIGWNVCHIDIVHVLNVGINPARYTSQTCSACGHCSRDNRKSQLKFLCVSCGMGMNADQNAALNIKFKAQGTRKMPSELAGDSILQPESPSL